jgi:hypothetical protein
MAMEEIQTHEMSLSFIVGPRTEVCEKILCEANELSNTLITGDIYILGCKYFQ